MATVSEEAERLCDQLGEDYTDLDVSGNFHDWVIEVVEDILSRESWPFSKTLDTITTVSGTKAYSLDADVADIRLLFRSDNDFALTATTEERLRKRNLDPDTSGSPTHWYISSVTGDQAEITLWPKPDSAIEILVYGNSRTNSLTSTSTIPLPSEVIRVMRLGVRQLTTTTFLISQQQRE